MPENPGAVRIIDDDASFRMGLLRLLRSHGYTCEAYESSEAFLRGGLTGRTGCILLDVHMPGGNGLALQEALACADCRLPIVFLSGRADIPMSVRAIKAGAFDFLTKPVDEETLLQAVRRAIEESERLEAAHDETEAVAARIGALTAREHEVMCRVITGALNKQIAASLQISEKTVKVHRGRVMAKMGVRSVAELVRLCTAAGLPGLSTTKVL